MNKGQRIKKLRTDNTMTQGDLGARIGVTAQTIFKYEEGIVTNIPLDKIEAIAAAPRHHRQYILAAQNPRRYQVQAA